MQNYINVLYYTIDTCDMIDAHILCMSAQCRFVKLTLFFDLQK